MGIEREVAVADVLDDVIACVLLQRQTRRGLPGYLLRQAVEYRDDGTIGHGVDLGAEPRIALGFGLVAVEKPQIRQQLYVVDREPLRGPQLSVERIECHPVWRHITATVGVHPIRSDERCRDDRRLTRVDTDG